MKLYFEDNSLDKDQQEIIKSMIEDDELDRDDIILEESDDENEFTEEHSDCTIYMVNIVTTGDWMQPICMVAVEE